MKIINLKQQFLFWCITGTAALLGACEGNDDLSSGQATILVESEDVILYGLAPGERVEDIRDGWAVQFDKYLATLGAIELRRSNDPDSEVHDETAYVIDLKQVSPSGMSLWELGPLEEGRWDIYYQTPGAGHGALQHESVSVQDYNAMVQQDWTYFVEGRLNKPDGQSCPPRILAQPGDRVPNGNVSGTNPCYDAPSVRFVFGVRAETLFGPCEIDGVPGIAVTSDNGASAALTIHGDHLFFNGFPEGSEGGVMRLAQWLADCDLNLDGEVSGAELSLISPSQLPEIDSRYQLGASPITPIQSMADYVNAQFKTQGHFQGEGECPMDGIEHHHGHDH